MTPYDLAVIGSGMTMGLWLDRLLGPAPRLACLTLGALALAVLLLSARIGPAWRSAACSAPGWRRRGRRPGP